MPPLSGSVSATEELNRYYKSAVKHAQTLQNFWFPQERNPDDTARMQQYVMECQREGWFVKEDGENLIDDEEWMLVDDTLREVPTVILPHPNTFLAGVD